MQLKWDMGYLRAQYVVLEKHVRMNNMASNFTAIDDLVNEYKAMKYGAGSGIKESPPITPSPEAKKNDEAQEEEPKEKDVNEYITPKKDETIILPPDLKKIGVQTTNDDGQFHAALYKLKLPISDEKIIEDLKAKPTESKRWYATILKYMLQLSHISLKKVGSKVVRVFKTN